MTPLPPAVIDDTLAVTGEEIDARKIRTRMTVEVNINGQGPYRFLVDSGADSSVVGIRLAQELQLPLTTPVPGLELDAPGLMFFTSCVAVPSVRHSSLPMPEPSLPAK